MVDLADDLAVDGDLGSRDALQAGFQGGEQGAWSGEQETPPNIVVELVRFRKRFFFHPATWSLLLAPCRL
jgi:hypothetical protein